MDLIAVEYESDMKPFRDRPDVIVRGAWHFSPPGAKIIPYGHCFAAHIWDPNGATRNPPLGEQFGKRGRVRVATNPRYTGQNWCGSEDVWVNGAFYAARGTPAYDAEGIPVCCNALPLNPGGAMAEGSAEYTGPDDNLVVGVKVSSNVQARVGAGVLVSSNVQARVGAGVLVGSGLAERIGAGVLVSSYVQARVGAGVLVGSGLAERIGAGVLVSSEVKETVTSGGVRVGSGLLAKVGSGVALSGSVPSTIGSGVLVSSAVMTGTYELSSRVRIGYRVRSWLGEHAEPGQALRIGYRVRSTVEF